MLQALTDEVGRRVSDLYARGLAGVDACAGTLDEAVSNFSMAVARAGAWESAVALANARGDVERRVIRRMLDLRSAVMARLILAPNLNPVLLASAGSSSRAHGGSCSARPARPCTRKRGQHERNRYHLTAGTRRSR